MARQSDASGNRRATCVTMLLSLLGSQGHLLAAEAKRTPRPVDVREFIITADTPAAIHWELIGPGKDIYRPTTQSSVPLPAGEPFVLRDYEGKTIESKTLPVTTSDARVETTVRLPAGYFEAVVDQEVFGIISLPPAPAKRDPFFAIDAGMSVLGYAATDATREQLVAVLVRCGIDMARERASWAALNEAPGQWTKTARADTTRRQYQQAKLGVLECFQDAPAWTVATPLDPYPRDLVATRDSWLEAGKRWGESWGAVEVWNEPNLSPFPADLWSSMLKATSYGVRESSPATPCGGGAISTFDQPFMSQVAANRALGAMDYVSFHSYSPPGGIEDLVARYRRWLAAAGVERMPLWLTEVGQPWPRGSARPAAPADRATAATSVMQLVESKACGVERAFAFLFGYYDEAQNNFGLMGRDNTPLRRMAALANLVQVLSNAGFAGDITGIEGLARCRVFVRPGEDQAILVLYSPEAPAAGGVKLDLPVTRIAGLDGRTLQPTADGRIPLPDGLIFAWAPKASLGARLKTDTETMRLYQLSQGPKPPRQPISPLVLRFLPDTRRLKLSSRGYEIPDPFDGKQTVRVRLANLADQPQKARVRASVASAAGKSVVLGEQVVQVLSRAAVDLEWPLDLTPSPLASDGMTDVFFDAELAATEGKGAAPGERLAVRFLRPVGIGKLMEHYGTRLDTPIREVQRWKENMSPGGKTSFAPLPDGGIHIEADFAPTRVSGSWAYPQFFGMPPADRMHNIVGMMIRARCEGPQIVRLFATEKSGAKYIRVSPTFPADGKWHDVFVSFGDFNPFAGPSDPNGRLDPDQLQAIEIGFNHGLVHNVLDVEQIWFVGDEKP